MFILKGSQISKSPRVRSKLGCRKAAYAVRALMTGASGMRKAEQVRIEEKPTIKRRWQGCTHKRRQQKFQIGRSVPHISPVRLFVPIYPQPDFEPR